MTLAWSKRIIQVAWLAILPLYILGYVIDGVRDGWTFWVVDGRTFWRDFRAKNFPEPRIEGDER